MSARGVAALVALAAVFDPGVAWPQAAAPETPPAGGNTPPTPTTAATNTTTPPPGNDVKDVAEAQKETTKELEGVAKQLQEVADAQKKANERLDELAKKDDANDAEAKSASRFIEYGVTLGAAYTVAFDVGGDARIHGLQSAGFTGYIAAFPAYWFSSAGANAYCAAQWSASESALRAAEDAASSTSLTIAKQLAGLKRWLEAERDELKTRRDAARASLVAAAGDEAGCKESTVAASSLDAFCNAAEITGPKRDSAKAAFADFAFYQHLESHAARVLTELASRESQVVRSRRKALKNLVEIYDDRLAALQHDPKLTPKLEDAVQRKARGDLGKNGELTADERAGLTAAFDAVFLERAMRDTELALREQPIQHPALCLPNKLGTYVGVSAPFEATVYLANVPDGGLVRREVSPAFSFGGVLAPNALFSVLAGVSFGQVERTADGNDKRTEPIVMGTIGIGGNLDLVSVFK